MKLLREEIVAQKNCHLTSQNQSEHTTALQQIQSLPIKYKAMRITMYILSKSLNVVYIPVFIYRAFEKPKKCTPVSDELLKIPASELARKIRRKEVSCEKVIHAYISRIKEVNPLLNAVIDDRFSEAIEDAKNVDQLVSSQGDNNDGEDILREYPLLGVPLTVKGSIAVKGLQYTSGMVTRKAVLAQNDAVAVHLARKAGAIPLLVSNVPELCMDWETSNKLIGTTKNPYDSTRTCGGSSGGEASLLGSGASLIGLGSDIAGSLRLPAHFCGVWSHKPTPGVVSYEGHYPSCNSDRWEAVFTLGPMARYAGDLRTLLGVISKGEKQERLGLSEKVDVKATKVYFTEMENFLWRTPNENCSGALQKVVSHFKTICDTQPKKVDLQLLQYATDLATINLTEIDATDNIFENFFTELLRYATFRSKHSFMTICFVMLRKINANISEKEKQKIKRNLEILRRDFENTLGKDGVLIMPTFPVEASKHGDSLRLAILSGYTSIFNSLGFPVTCCPVGMTKEGLPVGVQVIGLPYSDKLTLTVAEEIQKAFGGWISPA